MDAIHDFHAEQEASAAEVKGQEDKLRDAHSTADLDAKIDLVKESVEEKKREDGSADYVLHRVRHHNA